MAFGSNSVLFGKYELGRLLGCGAFAKVYYARHLRTGQSVALKVINKKKLVGTAIMANIKREITIMRRLRHPNIVRLHEVLATRTKIYFVMDFVRGGELFGKVAKGRFSEEVGRKNFRQLISAVGYCHSLGVYHRDLKPENLLVDENGDLRVSDFGLSAVKDQIHTDGLLHTLCGTPSYVAPEILTKKGYNGATVDIWSCGVILFVLTAGFLPFNDPNLMDMYRKIYRGEFKCPKWMSSDLKRFLSRLLDTNPKSRITIDEVYRDPWFRKDRDDDLHFHKGFEFVEEEDEQQDCGHTLNAFDLISFSAGLNLSGLFNESSSLMEDSERFVSKFSGETIMEKIEGLAIAGSLRVMKGKKKILRMELEGLNGGFIAHVEISKLTDELVLVEVNRKAGEASVYNEIWRKTLKPNLQCLVYQTDEQRLNCSSG